MIHLNLLLFFIILILGFWSIIKAIDLNRVYKIPYLRKHIIFIILINYCFFEAMIFEYFEINLFQISKTESFLFINQIIDIRFAIIFFLLIWFIKEGFRLIRRKKSNKKLNIALIFFFCVLLISHIYSFLVPSKVGGFTLFRFLVILIDLMLFLFPMFFSIQTFIFINKFYKKKQIYFIRRYCVIIFFLFFITFIDQSIYLLQIIKGYKDFFFFYFFFLVNILSLLLIKKFVRRVFPEYFQPQDKNDLLNSLYLEYRISKREQEIISFICEGCSNKEIGEELSISTQTVKDHTYSIYRKTKVKNRVQLSKLFR